MSESFASIDAMIDFWFSERVAGLWFNSTPEFDQELRDRFLLTYSAAKDGKLQAWQDSAQGALALVIILDQLPLNIFRNQPQSFATEAQAREVAIQAIDKGLDQQLSGPQKAFLYMPLMHSEKLADQERSVELYEAAGLTNNLRFAQHHRDIVKRFGRFPHRNAILGRESTKQELVYLNSKQAFHG